VCDGAGTAVSAFDRQTMDKLFDAFYTTEERRHGYRIVPSADRLWSGNQGPASWAENRNDGPGANILVFPYHWEPIPMGLMDSSRQTDPSLVGEKAVRWRSWGQQPLVSVVDDDESVAANRCQTCCGSVASPLKAVPHRPKAFLASEALGETRCLNPRPSANAWHVGARIFSRKLIRRLHQIPDCLHHRAQ